MPKKTSNTILHAGDSFKEVDPWFNCSPPFRPPRSPRIITIRKFLAWTKEPVEHGGGGGQSEGRYVDSLTSVGASFVDVVVASGRGEGSSLSLPLSQVLNPERWLPVHYTPKFTRPTPALYAVYAYLPKNLIHRYAVGSPSQKIVLSRADTEKGRELFLKKSRAGRQRFLVNTLFAVGFLAADTLRMERGEGILTYTFRDLECLNASGSEYLTAIDEHINNTYRYARSVLIKQISQYQKKEFV